MLVDARGVPLSLVAAGARRHDGWQLGVVLDAIKVRRWVVEVAHNCFNRFCKLLVRYEKLHHSYVALNHLAASIRAVRKIRLDVNIIYG